MDLVILDGVVEVKYIKGVGRPRPRRKKDRKHAMTA
jgi:hypothetical protein